MSKKSSHIKEITYGILTLAASIIAAFFGTAIFENSKQNQASLTELANKYRDSVSAHIELALSCTFGNDVSTVNSLINLQKN